ncbi:MAG: sulfatase-like hydrolase/transferase [Candidatus Hydrogenedentes bacterium]|nr:sulfatase-like hydrolase/transferase [Candidatus Hydrogenedentota bacterium]
MRRRAFLGMAGGAILGSALPGAASAQALAEGQRPNILWITCEDSSPHLGCYGCAEATTPNLDNLASQGLRYDLAFSVAGVCAPSRSCLITGMYPTSLGTCHMRCNNPPPDHVKCFPEYLRNAGYYCTNNVKTDYNFPPPPTAWDDSSKTAHWRNRPDPSKPFFSVFNFTITHESQIGTLPEKMGEGNRKLLVDPPHDPARMELPPYYPDTPVIRQHWAHYFDLLTAMDRQAGEVLKQLEEDGLAENTIVFFFGDHGVGLPRAKRWMYDCGLRVPFIVRWPGTLEAGTTTNRLVSFVDFAPTVLSIAGVTIPEHMQGSPFLGAVEKPAREYVFAARDRMDETYDMIRATRDHRYKYIRNYEPERAYDQYLTYPESFGVMQEMRRVEKAGELKGPELLFFRDHKPLEELYDTQQDPHELNNLAESSDRTELLNHLRAAMDSWMTEIRDLGCVPEFALAEWLAQRDSEEAATQAPPYPEISDSIRSIFGKPVSEYIGQLNSTDRIARLWAIKTLGILGKEVEPILIQALRETDSAVAYWPAMAFENYAPLSPEALDALRSAMAEAAMPVRIAAARTLYKQDGPDSAIPVILAGLEDPNEFVRLRAVEALDHLQITTPEVHAALERAVEDKTEYVPRIAKHALTRW